MGRSLNNLAARVLVPAHNLYERLEQGFLKTHDSTAGKCGQEPRPEDIGEAYCATFDKWNDVDDLNDKVNELINQVDEKWIVFAGSENLEAQAKLEELLKKFEELKGDLINLVPDTEEPIEQFEDTEEEWDEAKVTAFVEDFKVRQAATLTEFDSRRRKATPEPTPQKGAKK